METSDGRSVIRKRMPLYSISEGAGLMSFCFMMIAFASFTQVPKYNRRDFTQFHLCTQVVAPNNSNLVAVRQSNRQTVTLFPHNTLQFRYFWFERVQLYHRNNPHGFCFQPLQRIRRTINKSTECGMKTTIELLKKT